MVSVCMCVCDYVCGRDFDVGVLVGTRAVSTILLTRSIVLLLSPPLPMSVILQW
mgnify:CR=1 FL=1